MLKKTTVFTLVLCLACAGAVLAKGTPKKEEKGKAFAFYNKGVDFMQSGDFAAAQAKFEAALTEKEDFAEAHNNLAFSLRKQGEANYQKALEHYNRALELKPTLAEAYMYRGVLYVLQGEEEKAKADHKRLTELDRKLADELMQVIATGEEPEGLSGLAGRWDG